MRPRGRSKTPLSGDNGRAPVEVLVERVQGENVILLWTRAPDREAAARAFAERLTALRIMGSPSVEAETLATHLRPFRGGYRLALASLPSTRPHRANIGIAVVMGLMSLVLAYLALLHLGVLPRPGWLSPQGLQANPGAGWAMLVLAATVLLASVYALRYMLRSGRKPPPGG